MRIPYRGKLRSLRFWRKGPEIKGANPDEEAIIRAQLQHVPASVRRALNTIEMDPELPTLGLYQPKEGTIAINPEYPGSIRTAAGHELMHATQEQQSWKPFPWDDYVSHTENFEKYQNQPVEREARAAGWIADHDPQLPFDRVALGRALGSSPDWERGPAAFSRQLFGAESPELVLPPEMLPKTEIQPLLPFEGIRRSPAAPLEDEAWMEAVLQNTGLRQR